MSMSRLATKMWRRASLPMKLQARRLRRSRHRHLAMSQRGWRPRYRPIRVTPNSSGPARKPAPARRKRRAPQPMMRPSLPPLKQFRFLKRSLPKSSRQRLRPLRKRRPPRPRKPPRAHRSRGTRTNARRCSPAAEPWPFWPRLRRAPSCLVAAVRTTPRRLRFPTSMQLEPFPSKDWASLRPPSAPSLMKLGRPVPLPLQSTILLRPMSSSTSSSRDCSRLPTIRHSRTQQPPASKK